MTGVWGGWGGGNGGGWVGGWGGGLGNDIFVDASIYSSVPMGNIPVDTYGRTTVSGFRVTLRV